MSFLTLPSDMVSSCDPMTLLVGASIVLLMILVHFKRKPNKYPPGPLGLPLVGYAPFLSKNPAETLMKLKKKYGPVLSVQMGRDVWIVLNDYATINEALVKQGETFSGRPHNFFVEIFSKGFGIITADYGSTWKNLRKFGLKTLRGFGVGKKSMEVYIIEETSYLLEILPNTKRNETLRRKLEMAISNIISRIVFGSRFDYQDERFQTLIKVTENIFLDSAKAKIFAAVVFAPPLRFVPGFRGAIDSVAKGFQNLLGLHQELMNQHKASFEEDDIRDFIDAFLKEKKVRGDEDPSFEERQLLLYISDLFQAGTNTTSSTLHWSIFSFCHFPKTQEKIAIEVEKVIGNSGTPTMKHRDQMPCTCAFIEEIMRLKTLAPLGFFHKTNDVSTLGDYIIPKNSIIVPNLWAVHHDHETFANPDSFQPERFLDDNGNFVKSSHVIPFSVGPRHCLGEQLAKMEIFLFLTSIVQKYKMVPDPKSKLPAYEEFSHTMALTHEGPDFEVIFEKR